MTCCKKWEYLCATATNCQRDMFDITAMAMFCLLTFSVIYLSSLGRSLVS